VYTTCEAGKRRTVNHTRARARSPRRAGPGRAVAVAEAETRRSAARPAGRTGGARAHARPDVTCRCGAVRCGAV
jgi:hypothetical protein